jgi:hypothetical protein
MELIIVSLISRVYDTPFTVLTVIGVVMDARPDISLITIWSAIVDEKERSTTGPAGEARPKSAAVTIIPGLDA